MTPENFNSWRKAMGLKRKEAAALLGTKKHVICTYEKSTDHYKKAIPKAVELACYALSRGVSEFDGRTAKNSFNGLGASEDIEMVITKDPIRSDREKTRAKSSK